MLSPIPRPYPSLEASDAIPKQQILILIETNKQTNNHIREIEFFFLVHHSWNHIRESLVHD